MTDEMMEMKELIDKAKEFSYPGGKKDGDHEWPVVMFAEFAAECVRAERERVADEIERITNGSSCELNLLIQQLRTSK